MSRSAPTTAHVLAPPPVIFLGAVGVAGDAAASSFGPYRFSRNPDYLGQALVVAGLGLVLGNGWVLLALVPALLLVRYGVIAREERYLERKFGEDYRCFRRRVRRWLQLTRSR